MFTMVHQTLYISAFRFDQQSIDNKAQSKEPVDYKQTTEPLNAAVDVVNVGGDDPQTVKTTRLICGLNRVKTCDRAKSADIWDLSSPFHVLSNTQFVILRTL